MGILYDFSDKIPTLPFASDGCSGGLSWAWKTVFGEVPPFQTCCYEHDLEYHYGGTIWEKIIADAHLSKCIVKMGVNKSTNKQLSYVVYTLISIIVFMGVSIGGLPFWKQSFSWGFGWHPEWL